MPSPAVSAERDDRAKVGLIRNPCYNVIVEFRNRQLRDTADLSRSVTRN